MGNLDISLLILLSWALVERHVCFPTLTLVMLGHGFLPRASEDCISPLGSLGDETSLAHVGAALLTGERHAAVPTNPTLVSGSLSHVEIITHELRLSNTLCRT